jgi:cysteine desulfurase/selenocysteine lyase
MLLQERVHKLDIQKIRADFPILQQTVRDGKALVYLDNGATTHKPQAVIDRIANFYAHENGTVRRGVYALSEISTQSFEEARQKAASFINAKSSKEIVFVKGCTDAINLVARSFGGSNLKENDEILISALEHHANIVPWQIICAEKGAKLKVIPINTAGEIQIEEMKKLINHKTKLVAVSHISNALGSINPIKEIIEIAHSHGVPVLIDGAQGAPHCKVDVQELDCDFYTFSGHKIYGPTGIGVLYGKYEVLEKMPPYQGGGDMIEIVTFEKTTYAEPPTRFEAGTPAIAQAIGLHAAISYVENIGIEQIQTYENELLEYATEKLSEISELTIIGNAKNKASLISFVIDGIHPHDIGTILDHENGVAVRAGHHCAQPLMQFYKVPATTRASFAFYNTKEEIDVLANGLKNIVQMFK